MIRGLSVSVSGLAPGARCDLSVESDGDVEVTLHCFRRTPAPPRLVPCGSIVVQPGASTSIAADLVHFPAGSQGEIRLMLMDRSDGDVRLWSIPVLVP